MPSTVKSPSAIAYQPIAVWTLGGLFSANAVGLDSPIVAVPDISSYFSVGQGDAQLVIVLFLAGYAAGHIPMGLLGDRFGRRPVILSGLTIAAILSILAVFAPTFEVLLISRFLQGVATCAAGLLSRAVIRDVASGVIASKLTSSAMLVLAILIITTPLLSAFVLYVANWRFVLAVTSLYLIVMIALTYFLIPETMQTRKHESHPWQQFKDSAKSFLQSQQSIHASLLGAIAFATFFIFSAAGASLIVEVYELPASYFGVIFALTAFVQLLASAYNSRRVAVLGQFRILRRALAFSVLGLLISTLSIAFGDTPLVVLIIIASAFAISHALILPNSIAITLDPLPATAGFGAAIHGMLQTGMAAFAGLIVAFVYDASVETVLAVYCGFALSTIAILILGRRRFLFAQEES